VFLVSFVKTLFWWLLDVVWQLGRAILCYRLSFAVAGKDMLKVNSPFYSGSEHVGSTYIIYGYDWLSLCKYFHLFVHM
jgi:hypothetical protein